MGKFPRLSIAEEEAFLSQHPELKGLFPQFVSTYVTCRVAGSADSLEEVFVHMYGDESQGIALCSYCTESMIRKRAVIDSFINQSYVKSSEDDICDF
ncbi:MAG: hypothetical protein HZC02_00765 [Candidatus Levybacteria bacterium]|nr:hypothetical protein [Candidatus Levybacteria bacterium]